MMVDDGDAYELHPVYDDAATIRTPASASVAAGCEPDGRATTDDVAAAVTPASSLRVRPLGGGPPAPASASRGLGFASDEAAEVGAAHQRSQSPPLSSVVGSGSGGGAGWWTWRQYWSRLAEDVAFSTPFRAYVGLLLAGELVFVAVLAVRLAFAATVQVFASAAGGGGDAAKEFGTALGSLHALVCVACVAATVVDLLLRLLRSWAAMSRDSVHVFFLPNPFHTGPAASTDAVDLRNALLGGLLLVTGVAPLAAGCAAAAADGAPAFVGGFAFAAFAATGVGVAALWAWMWVRSLRCKSQVVAEGRACRAEHTSTEMPAERSVAWMRRVAANPLVMAEFGVDMLSVRAHCVHAALGCLCALVLSLSLGGSLSDAKWVAVAATVALGAMMLAASKARPSRHASKIAKRQRGLTFLSAALWTAFAAAGLAGAAASGSAGLAAANAVLLVLTQLHTVRRHDLHATGSYHLPRFDDEERSSATQCLPLLPCGDLMRLFLPKNPCFKRRSKRARQQREHDTSVLAAHHCAATEQRLDGTQRVLTADAKILTGFWAVFFATALVAATIGSRLDDELSGATVVGRSGGAGNATAVDAAAAAAAAATTACAACDLEWSGVGARDVAVLTLLATHATDAALEADVAAYFGAGRWTVEPAAAAGSRPDALAWRTFAHTSRNVSVVVAQASGSARGWVRSVDSWGDAALLRVLEATVPLVGAWSRRHKQALVSAVGTIAGALGTDRAGGAAASLALRSHVAGRSGEVLVGGHGMAGGHVVAAGLPATATVVLAAPGTFYAARGHERQGRHVNVVPKGGLLATLDEETGLGQETECDGGSVYECQTAARAVCDLLRSCGESPEVVLDACR